MIHVNSQQLAFIQKYIPIAYSHYEKNCLILIVTEQRWTTTFKGCNTPTVDSMVSYGQANNSYQTDTCSSCIACDRTDVKLYPIYSDKSEPSNYPAIQFRDCCISRLCNFLSNCCFARRKRRKARIITCRFQCRYWTGYSSPTISHQSNLEYSSYRQCYHSNILKLFNFLGLHFLYRIFSCIFTTRNLSRFPNALEVTSETLDSSLTTFIDIDPC